MQHSHRSSRSLGPRSLSPWVLVLLGPQVLGSLGLGSLGPVFFIVSTGKPVNKPMKRASVITGLDYWTGLLDSNFNALKTFLCSLIIFIYLWSCIIHSNNLQG